MSKPILIVEHDRQTADMAARVATGLGARPVIAQTLEEGIRLTKADGFRVIILDRNLPDGDGADAMARVRAGAAQAMVLVLTAMDHAENRIGGLENGADDYLAKPFRPEQLQACLSTLLRRHAMLCAEADLLSFPGIEIRSDERTVQVHKRTVAVSPREFDLISYLARHEGEVVTRAELLENVWNLRFDPGTNVVDVHVGRLRRKLEQAGTHAIHTARGAGYIFAPMTRGHGAAT